MSSNKVRTIGLLLAATATVLLAWYFAAVGLEEADRLASVLGVFVGLAGLLIAIFGPALSVHTGRTIRENVRDRGVATHNTVSGGTIHGSILQGHEFSGPVNLGGSSSRPTSEPDEDFPSSG